MVVPVVPSSSGEDGNTSTSSPPLKEKKKQVSPAIHWCFTWNNYPEDWKSYFSSNSSKISGYVFGKEVGEQCGTPHIQGYVRFCKKLRPKGLFPKGIHWEKTNNIDASIDYCRKDGDYEESNVREKLKLIGLDDLYSWQKDVVDIVSGEPDDRKIHWFWERNGNVGKSALVKFLCVHYNALVCSGKSADMKFLVANYYKNKGFYPKVLIMDIPRSCRKYVNYTGIEEIKNGCFASTKYECDMIVMNSPHFICFANDKPKIDKMSEDRWVIRCLDESEEQISDNIIQSETSEMSVFDF